MRFESWGMLKLVSLGHLKRLNRDAVPAAATPNSVTIASVSGAPPPGRALVTCELESLRSELEVAGARSAGDTRSFFRSLRGHL